ncbi:MAG: hypothetical protein NZ518_02060, partial [Dehalococcoidia bacterium]|nr:hypothetical protein [Dehalococcoidia bacterium]
TPDVTLLSANSAIARAYHATPNAAVVLGAPLAFQDFGPVQSLRTERAVIQQWLVETSFAPRNGVLIPNTGDLLGAAGVLPRTAAEARNLQFFTGPTTFGAPLTTVVHAQPFFGYAPFFPFFAPTVQSQPNFFPFAFGYTFAPFAPTGFNPFVYPYYTFSPFIFSQPVVQPQPVFQPVFAAPVVQPFFPNRPFLCLGDELMTFSPTRPRTNQQFTISVTSARPHSPVSLRGPGNPRFAGVVGGGRGFIWNWVATITEGGVYNFDFIVADGATVCTANIVTVDG